MMPPPSLFLLTHSTLVYVTSWAPSYTTSVVLLSGSPHVQPWVVNSIPSPQNSGISTTFIQYIYSMTIYWVLIMCQILYFPWSLAACHIDRVILKVCLKLARLTAVFTDKSGKAFQKWSSYLAHKTYMHHKVNLGEDNGMGTEQTLC